MANSILLVDDEEIILSSLSMDFRQENFNVSTANSGEAAVKLLKDNSFEMIITDLSMPGMSGIELLQVAKKNDPLVAVIILTGFGDMSTAVDALRLGADDYLLKPCEHEELIIRVNRSLAKRDMAVKYKLQTQKLIESEAEKTLLLNSVNEGIYGIDENGITTFLNNAAEKMLGFSSDEMVGKNSHWLIHHTKKDGSYYPFEECRMVEAFKKRKKIYENNEILWRKDGTSFSVEYSGTPLINNNEVVGAVIVFSDITEKEKRIEKQKKLEVHLRQLQKFQSLNSMAAGIAHNFNNIFSAVIGNQELALDDLSDDHPAKPFILDALKSSKRAAKLSSMMLQYVGQGKVNLELLELNSLCREIISVLSSQVNPNIEFSFTGEDVFIYGDSSMVRQVIINLVTNAVEAIGETGGSIRIICERKFFDKKDLNIPHLQKVLPAGDYVSLSVVDSAANMSEESLHRAFEPFYTTRFVGRGMGLATVLGIMRILKGAIFLECVPGRHTTAMALFPAYDEVIKEDKPATVRTETKKELTGTALLVDDDDTIRYLSNEYLIRLGFKVITASDGVMALDLFKENIENINLVVLDFAMPRMSGADVVKIIREKSNVPVLVITGYLIDEVTDQLKGIKNLSILKKPYVISEFNERIYELFK